MIRYLKCSVITLLIVLSSTLFSCVNQDIQFGNSLVPPDQGMTTDIDETTIVPQTYIYALDSIITSGLLTRYRVVGSIIDPLVGRTNAQFFANYVPVGVNYDHYFGVEPTIDSMFLILTFADYRGDTVRGMDVEVFEVMDGDYRQSVRFFSNYDISKNLNDTALIKFTVTGPDVVIKKLPIEFAKKFLINTPGDSNPYWSDSLFHKAFKGLYVKSNEFSSGNGCIYNVDLNSSTMKLFYHNKGGLEEADTTTIDYVFYSDIYGSNNTTFSTSQHDFSFANPSVGGVDPSQIGKLDVQTEHGYIEGLGGLGTWVVFPEEQIEQLLTKARSLGYSTVAVNSAELKLTISDQTWQNYDQMMDQLAMYFSINEPKYIPDYNPKLANSETIGGKLNRSLGIYTLDITRYIQGRLTGKITESKLELEPSIAYYLYARRGVIMGSASDMPPKLTITYTMLK